MAEVQCVINGEMDIGEYVKRAKAEGAQGVFNALRELRMILGISADKEALDDVRQGTTPEG